jgi:signal transduction histidine kinase
MIRTFLASALAAALLAGPAWSETAADFDRLVGEAKSSMMADPETALARSRAALDAARKAQGHESRVRMATAQWLEGEALLRLNRLAEAGPVIQDGLAIAAREAANTKLHGDLTLAEGSVLAMRGEVQGALKDFHAAYRIFGAAHETRSQAMVLQDIGSIYQDAGDYPKVLQYYAQSAELHRDDPVLLVTASNNVGNALKEQGRFAEAVAEFHKALAIARGMQSPLIEAQILENLASTEVAWGKLDAADKDIAAGLKLYEADPAAAEFRPFLWGVAAQAALKRGHPAQAAGLLESTFDGVDLTSTPLPYRDFHRTAYETYKALGDDRRALAHLEAYKRLGDAASALAASTNAALMAAQFDFANQASRIAQLKAAKLQRDVQLVRSRNTITLVLLIGSVVIACLLLAGMLWIRRSRNEVRRANGLLNVANASLERALAARTEFLATTSHEIRTPLNGILGMTEVLMRDAGLEPAVREKIAVVHGAGETMRALVDDILDVAKIETGKLVINRAEMDLRQLFDGAVRLWSDRARDKGVSLRIDVGDAPPRIVEDATRLRQIVFNLMSNAIKFTHQGSVSLSAKVEVFDHGEELVISVADTGIGIPADRLADIFESFSQVDGSVSRIYGGTGLGLSICRSLAAAMGGDISVRSALGEGSVFTVRLPLVRAEAATPALVEAEAAAFEDCRLLLVDANPLTQAVIRAVLAPTVRSVDTVASGEEATAAAAASRFDIVLADAMALGGDPAAQVAAAHTLAATIAPAPLAVMAADLGEDSAVALLRAGVAQIIRKPIPASALIGELAAGFEGRRHAQDGAWVSLAS